MLDVAIVGAGVAGASAAAAFSSSGLDVGVYERRALPGDINRGDALHAEAVEILRGWGAFPALGGRGAFWVRRALLTTSQDHPRVRVHLDEPFLMLEHAGIETALLETAAERGVEVYQKAVRALEPDGAGWRLSTDHDEVRCRLVIGADGAKSVVRRAARIESDGERYTEVSVVLHAPLPRWLPDDSSCAVFGPDGLVLILPTTPPGMCRVVTQVALSQLPRWREASPRELRWLLGRRNPRLADLEVERRFGSHVYKLRWQHARRYVRSGLALIGDAAHITHPNGGQGMAMAIHDAASLERVAVPVLQDACNGRADLNAALWEYAARRRQVNADALARADRMAKFTHGNRPAHVATMAALGLFSLAPSVFEKLMTTFGGE